MKNKAEVLKTQRSIGSRWLGILVSLSAGWLGCNLVILITLFCFEKTLQGAWAGALFLSFYFLIFSIPVIAVAGLLVFAPVYWFLPSRSPWWNPQSAAWLGLLGGFGFSLVTLVGTGIVAGYDKHDLQNFFSSGWPLLLLGAASTGALAGYVAAKTRCRFRDIHSGHIYETH